MTLAVGTRVGPYEIAAPLVAEESGIWKATDTEQGRTVTLKVLPEPFLANAEKRARLERQVQILTGLNHPNICVVHELRREDDADVLAMEFVEGQTVADRLKKGALPLDQAVKIGLAVGEALHTAHAAGVVHGHLKPSNIMLAADGTVKIVDFGLAKWECSTAAAPAGTPAPDKRAKGALPDVPDDIVRYLAPERIDGKDADVRSDIFAFGATLYEMVTGQPAFEGRNRAMLVAAISNLDPYPLSKTEPHSPAMLDHIAQRCLAKDPDDRWQTWHDLLVQLRWVAEGGDVGLAAARARQRRERRTLAIVAAAVFLATVLTVTAFAWREAPEPAAMQFRVPVGGLSSPDIAISPDGRLLALVAAPGSGDQPALYVRPTGETVFRKLVGTEGAAQPFWSPDSRSIGFWAGGRLKRVDSQGGTPKDLGAVSEFMGGAWGSASVILFGSKAGLWRVSAEGGNPEPATAVDTGEEGHYWPSFLPDGQRFLYLSWATEPGNRAIHAGALASKDRTKVMGADSNPVYAAPGYIVFHRGATLFAQAFDAQTLTPSGDALHIADQLEFNATTGRGSFDVSQHGALVFFQSEGGGGGGGARGGPVSGSQWGWRDRTGNTLALASETGTYGDMDLSPDGKLIAVTQFEGTGSAPDIWVIDWQRAGVAYRVTLDRGDDINPVWSRPTGDRVAFTTYRNGNADIYIKNANGTGDETPLVNSSADELIEDWSKDGKYIAYKLGAEATADIWVLPTFGDKKPFPVVEGPYRKDEPQFSYDGKWLAYVSYESGDIAQVYVTSFPGREQKIKVSKDGGGQPRWREDGKELLFMSPEGQAMAVEFRPGPAVSAGVPQRLFGLTGGAPGPRVPTRHMMAVTPDGQRFLVRMPAGGAAGSAANVPFIFPGATTTTTQQTQAEISAGLTVIRHWPALVGAAMPSTRRP